ERGGGWGQGRGGDPAERGFRHFVNSEGEKPRGGQAKPDGTMGLVLNKPQCSCKTFHFARIGIERGVQKKKPDHREHKRARDETKSPQRYDQSPLVRCKFPRTPELSPDSSNADAKTKRRYRRTDRPDDPLAERLSQDPSRPVMRDLIAAAAGVGAQHRVQRRGGEAHVEHGGSP